jgi:hypothetical protein
VAEVFAGFVVGFALSMLAAPISAVALVRSNDRTGFAQRVAPEGTNVVALSVVIHFAAMIVLTGVGLALGMALAAIDARRPDGGLGSPNVAYTLLVLAFTAAAVIPALAVPAARRYALIGGALFALSFGWAMPWLASLGS